MEDGVATALRGPVRGARNGTGSRLPLADLRVLDLGMVWAGPYCGRLLAGLGATVIKVEGPRRMDGTRAGGRGDCAGAFGDLNRGKASLVLDLASRAGRDSFLRLVRGADVVLENYSPRVMPNFGLDDPDALGKRIEQLQQLAREAGRDEIPVTGWGAPRLPDLTKRLEEVGVHRVIWYLPPEPPEELRPRLERYAERAAEITG